MKEAYGTDIGTGEFQGFMSSCAIDATIDGCNKVCNVTCVQGTESGNITATFDDMKDDLPYEAGKYYYCPRNQEKYHKQDSIDRNFNFTDTYTCEVNASY